MGCIMVNNTVMYERMHALWKVTTPDGSRRTRLDCCLVRAHAAFAQSIIEKDMFSNAISGVLLVKASVGSVHSHC